MTIAAPTAADYTTSIQNLRESIRDGVPMNDYDSRLTLACLKDAVDQFDAASVEITATDALVTTTLAAAVALSAEWTTQIGILQAGGAGDISAAVDTAETTIQALVDDVDDEVALLATASAALVTADPSGATYVVSTVQDG